MLFVEAQLNVLKAIRAYIAADKDSSTQSDTPFFGLSLPTSLVNSALALISLSPEAVARRAVEDVSRIRLPEKHTMGDVKNYMDVSIRSIEQYCKAAKAAR